MSADNHTHTSWHVQLLGEVADITLGGTPSTEVAGFWDGDIPWMASGEVNKRHVFEVDGRITESGLAASNATLVDPPMVAIGLAGQGKTRGTAALVHIRVCTNQSIALIQGRSGELDTRFLFHNLDNRYQELRSRSAGGGRAGLSREILQKVPMSLPDPREQSRIAAVLDTVDEAIATTEAVIAKLKQMRAGLLHDVFTCGLDEHGRLRDPIAHPEQFQDSPLGRIPREWARRALRDCLVDNPQNGIYKPAGAIGHGTLLIGQTSITDERSIDVNLARRAEVTIQERGRYELETDDILVSRVFATLAGVGQPALVPEFREPAVYESNMMRLRTRRAVVAPSLLFHWLRTARIRALLLSGVNLSNQASVNQQALNGLPVIVPPVREQERMLVAICASDELAQATSSELGKLVQLRSGLMTDLLSGRVRVPETLFPVETSA